MKYIFLNDKFYNEHTQDKYPQLELKQKRPYIHIQIEKDGQKFALPLRSNISHPYAFLTDRANQCGVDYSKAVPITDDDIDTAKPFIRPNEHKKLIGKEYRIKKGFEKYIQTYINALSDKKYEHRKEILAYSSLQYFHEELGIK